MSKTIVVTGCTKGIGLSIAKTFAQAGFNIAGCARNRSELNGLNELLNQVNPSGKHTLLCCDISVVSEVETFAAAINKAYPGIDILVNNAGVFLPGNIHTEASGTLEKLLQTNVTGNYYMTRGFLPGMMEKRQGHIFNICSIASLQAYEGGGSYSISKFALLGFSKQLRHEMKPHGVRVTAIMPGATYTNSWAGSGLPEDRFMKADDIALTIKSVYELSDHTDVEEIIMRPVQGDI